MKKPLVLCILDGCGVREEKDGNAFANANKPTLDMLMEKYPHSILEAMAEIHNCTDRLNRYAQNEIEQRDEQVAKEIQLETRTRAENFTFSEAQIPIGAVLEYKKDASITCKVVDDRRVDYQGEIMYLTGVVKKITGTTSAVAGPRYFKYKGADLWNINGRVE